MQRDEMKFHLSILGLSEIHPKLLRKISHMVSLVDPGTLIPYKDQVHTTCEHLVLEIHDALDSSQGIRAPNKEDIEALCHYADKISTEQITHMVIHCHMGRSRSTAAAAIILTRLGYSPSVAFEHILSVRNPIWPNWTMIEHGDIFLNCDGELLKACQQVYQEVKRDFPKWVEDPRPESINPI